MGVALSLAELSFAGIVYSFIILNTMINADKIFMKIFGIDRASSLADVNKIICDRSDCFYWQTDRQITVEEQADIWIDHHSAKSF